MSAADLIRQHLEALPEECRRPWQSVAGDVYTEPDSDGRSEVIAYAYESRGALIALLASPHVAEALAELLEAIRHHEEGVADFEAIQFCRDVLEAAISREGRSDGA